MASRRRLRNFNPAPGRAAVKAAAVSEPAGRVPGQKDRRHWCKGKEGREHQPAIVFCPPPAFRPGQVYQCEWDGRWVGAEVEWRCYHEEHCTACGRILRASVEPPECPHWPGSEEQHLAALAAVAEAAERWAEWRSSRRPVISGPQHYRRKRASA